MAILTVKDSKTGKVLRKVDGSTGRVVKDYSKSGGGSSSSSSSSGTKIKIISDSKEDEGKSFAGQEIKIVPKRSGGGGSSSNTKISIKSDSLDDVGKSFAGQQINTEPAVKKLVNSNKNARDLFNMGLSSQAVTQILAARETNDLSKFKNLDTSKFFDKLQNKNIAVDQTSQAQAYKIAVNQVLEDQGKKQLNFNNDIKTFQKKYNQVVEEKKKQEDVLKKFTNPSNKDLANLIKNDEMDLINKVVTGQSMTPQQIKDYQVLVEKKGNQMTQQQLKMLKNAPKDIVVGLYEVGREIVMLPVSAVKASYNYGVNSAAKANANGESVLNVWGDDIRKVGKGTKEVATFVKDNPKAAAAIVGTAAAVVGKNLLTEFIKNPVKTTTKAVGYFYSGKVIQKGLSFVRGPVVAEKYSKTGFKVTQELTTGAAKIEGSGAGVLKNGKKFTSTYKLRYDPKTKVIEGEVKTKIGKKTITEKVKLVDDGPYYKDVITGQKVSKSKVPIDEQKIKIKEQRIKDKGKIKDYIVNGEVAEVYGQDITTIVTNIFDKTKKVTTRTSELRIAVDPKTKKEIFRISKQLSKITKKSRTNLAQGFTKEQVAQLESFLKSIDYDKTILNGMDKRTRLAQALGLRKDAKVIKAIESAVDDTGKIKKVIKAPSAKEIKIKKLEALLEKKKKVNPNSTEVVKLEKQLAKLKGTKNINLGKLEDIDKKNIKVRITKKGKIKGSKAEDVKNINLGKAGDIETPKEIIKRTGRAKIKATLERGEAPKAKVKVKMDRPGLRKNKSGSVSFVRNNQIEVNVKAKTKLGRRGYIEIPELKAKLPLNPVNLRFYGITGLVDKVIKDLKTLNKKEVSFTNLKDKLKDINKDITKIQTKIKEVEKVKDIAQEKVKDVANKKKPLTTNKTTNVPATKTTTKTTTKLKIGRVPAISPKTPPRVPKIKTPKGKSRDKRELVRVTKKGLIEFKEGNRIRRIKTNLPYDKALKVASRVVDNSVIASMTVKPYGNIPKSKAVSVDLSKFTSKKGKNPLVREIVEKSKYRLDTAGEKKGLKAAKLLKKELIRVKAKSKSTAASKTKAKIKAIKAKKTITKRKVRR